MTELTQPPLVSVEGTPVLFECLSATFQLKLLEPETADVLQQANDIVRAALGDRLKWVLASFRLGVQPYNDNTLEHVAAYCKRLAASEPSGDEGVDEFVQRFRTAQLNDFHVFCKGGAESHDASPLQYQFWVELDCDSPPGEVAPAIATLRICLPVDWPLEEFRQLFLQLVEVLPLRWASAGLGYSWWYPSHAGTAADGVYGHARRYPGFEIPLFVRNPEFVYFAIPTANWLVFVGRELHEVRVERSAPNPVELRLVTIAEAAGGVLLQAGPVPQPGDKNRRQFPASYAEMDRYLYPIRLGPHWAEIGDMTVLGKWDTDTLTEWLQRFEGK